MIPHVGWIAQQFQRLQKGVQDRFLRGDDIAEDKTPARLQHPPILGQGRRRIGPMVSYNFV